jgi:Alkylmercury lyase
MTLPDGQPGSGAELSSAAKKVRRLLYEEYLGMRPCPNEPWIAAHAGLTSAELRQVLSELDQTLMLMLVPGTAGVIGKCPPWTNLPTRHTGRRADADGFVFLGCALEAINYPYCHPGTEVSVESSCPSCGAVIGLRLKDGQVLGYDPPQTVAHIGVNPYQWSRDWFAACENNNFFCSPAHVDAWEARYPRYRGVRLSVGELRGLTNYRMRLDFERGGDGGGERIGDILRQRGLAPADW